MKTANLNLVSMHVDRTASRSGSGLRRVAWRLGSALALLVAVSGVLESSAAESKAAPSAKTRQGVSKGSTASKTNVWVSLFDGKTLRGWKEADFAGKGEVRVEKGRIILGMGYMTGIVYTNPTPKMNYEVQLEAMRVDGSDFFCGLTFPVNDTHCSLILGGWGGGLVGLSSLDGLDASSNETTRYIDFKNGRWYQVRLRVTPKRIKAWIDDEKVVDANIEGREVGIRIEMEECLPFGIATWSTTGAVRNIRLRSLTPLEVELEK